MRHTQIFHIHIYTMQHDKMETLDITPPDQVSKTETMARGTEALFVTTSDCLPGHPTKDGRATDSCFALIRAHQCDVLMVNAG